MRDFYLVRLVWPGIYARAGDSYTGPFFCRVFKKIGWAQKRLTVSLIGDEKPVKHKPGPIKKHRKIKAVGGSKLS